MQSQEMLLGGFLSKSFVYFLENIKYFYGKIIHRKTSALFSENVKALTSLID